MSDCEFYGEGDQTCMTAGLEVVAAEGLCGPCAVRKITELAALEAECDEWERTSASFEKVALRAESELDRALEQVRALQRTRPCRHTLRVPEDDTDW